MHFRSRELFPIESALHENILADKDIQPILNAIKNIREQTQAQYAEVGVPFDEKAHPLPTLKYWRVDQRYRYSPLTALMQKWHKDSEEPSIRRRMDSIITNGIQEVDESFHLYNSDDNALDHAAVQIYQPNGSLVKFLLEYKSVDPNKEHGYEKLRIIDKLFSYSSRHYHDTHMANIKTLLEDGRVNIHSKNSFQCTVLDNACKEGFPLIGGWPEESHEEMLACHLEKMRYLLSLGVDVNSVHPLKKTTALERIMGVDQAIGHVHLFLMKGASIRDFPEFETYLQNQDKDDPLVQECTEIYYYQLHFLQLNLYILQQRWEKAFDYFEKIPVAGNKKIGEWFRKKLLSAGIEYKENIEKDRNVIPVHVADFCYSLSAYPIPALETKLEEKNDSAIDTNVLTTCLPVLSQVTLSNNLSPQAWVYLALNALANEEAVRALKITDKLLQDRDSSAEVKADAARIKKYALGLFQSQKIRARIEEYSGEPIPELSMQKNRLSF